MQLIELRVNKKNNESLHNSVLFNKVQQPTYEQLAYWLSSSEARNMSNKIKVFEGRWEPPSHLAPEKPSSSGIRDLFWYSPYWGWSSDVVPVLFKTPAKALCWGISRFKRDGLSNTWGPDQYPDFLYFVFIVSFRSVALLLLLSRQLTMSHVQAKLNKNTSRR